MTDNTNNTDADAWSNSEWADDGIPTVERLPRAGSVWPAICQRLMAEPGRPRHFPDAPKSRAAYLKHKYGLSTKNVRLVDADGVARNHLYVWWEPPEEDGVEVVDDPPAPMDVPPSDLGVAVGDDGVEVGSEAWARGEGQ